MTDAATHPPAPHQPTPAAPADRSPSVPTLGWRRFAVGSAAGIVPIAAAAALPMGTWADLSSLPMHPLIVHGVVVLLPVAAIWTVVAAWRPTVLRRSHTALWALTVVACVGVVAATSSGNSLAAAVGLPVDHADAGNRLVPAAVALAVGVLVIVFCTQVRPRRVPATASRVAAGVVAVAVLPLTYAAGHSGATAVWEEPYAQARRPIATGTLSLSMAEVRRHATADDCWAVVEGVVYDLTTFVARHPAGAGDIVEMCGTDATEDFVGEHGGAREPEQWLETLRIGVLAAS